MLVIQRPSVEAIGDDHPTRQRFAVGPLEPGFGHTIGNSLRRTLLSSIPGAAITTVKFDGVEHEFTVIKGMTEDITEFIMNLKDVVVVSRSDEPVVVRIDVKGPMVLTAADIPTTADIDILNPSLHLATLNAGAQLALDLRSSADAVTFQPIVMQRAASLASSPLTQSSLQYVASCLK